MSTQELPSPIEVWLTQKNLEITCMEVHEDESVKYLDVDSLSMRGAQREITGWYIGHGYVPAGRWQDEETGESVRKFKIADASVRGQAN